MNIKDLTSTLTGGGVGLALLATVKWEAEPHGELLKAVAAFVLIGVGYLMYRRQA